MIHELLVAMSGYPGDVFVPSPPAPLSASTFVVRPDFPYLHPAERGVLNRLAQLGFWVRELTDFADHETAAPPSVAHADAAAERTTGYGHGCYSHGLATGVRRVVSDYLAQVDAAETELLGSASGLGDHGGRTPWAKLAADFAPVGVVLEAVVMLVREYRARRLDEYYGVRVLDLVLPRLLDGRPPVAAAMRHLAHACLAVFFKHLAGYLLHASAHDPWREFFIVPETSAAGDGEAGRTGGREYEQFRIESALVPTALVSPALAESILFTVTSSYIVQKSPRSSELITPAMWQNQLHILSRLLDVQTELRPLDLTIAMDSIRRDYTHALWKIMVLDEKMLDYLAAIKTVYLGGNGAFHTHFLSQVAHLESRAIEHGAGVGERELNFALHSSYSQTTPSSGADPASAALADIVKQFRFTLTTESDLAFTPFRHLPVTTPSSSDETPATTTATLTLPLPWPLSLVLPASHLAAYNRAFHALSHLRRVHARLVALHLPLRAVSQRYHHRGPLARTAFAACTARTEMLAVLDSVLGAAHTAIEAAYARLVDVIRADTESGTALASLDDWRAHAAQLAATAEAAVFLPASAAAVRDALARVVGVADLFAGVVEASVGEQQVREWAWVEENSRDGARRAAGGTATGGMAAANSAETERRVRAAMDDRDQEIHRLAEEFHGEARFFYQLLEGLRGRGAALVQDLLLRLDYNRHWTLGPLRQAGGRVVEGALLDNDPDFAYVGREPATDRWAADRGYGHAWPAGDSMAMAMAVDDVWASELNQRVTDEVF
ncbi:hypothetical protein H9P43_008538 [Blastocladiella emersonii ATCC 22665]|nr:hypothetical protein H9P43_008538 [Blastocladiella emersonii ATCC 22665]